MSKKRKVGGKGASGSGLSEPDSADARLNVRTWEDVADSEDEFHLGRDKILLEEEPSRKRQRLQEERDAYLEPSDEEVLALPDSDSDLDDDDLDNDEDETSEEVEDGATFTRKKMTSKSKAKSDSEEEEEDEEEGGWGTSKRDYYNADNVETEQDALDEEEEALRLQKKQLQDMTEADYGFDENEWLGGGNANEDEGEEGDVVVQELLPDMKITEDMTPQERTKILETRYPEFAPLAKEFVSLQEEHEDLVLADNAAKAVLKHQTHDSEQFTPVASIKRNALGGYLASLSMYFTILSSGSRASAESLGAKPPAELREHPIMETIVQSRTLWEKVKDIPLPDLAELVAAESADDAAADEEPEFVDDTKDQEEKPKKKRKSKAERAAAKARREVELQKAEKLRRIEQRLANMDDKVMLKPAKSNTNAPEPTPQAPDEDSDFGEETLLTAEEAAEKARRKRGLRFYTAQIAQKSNKRGAAGRNAGGDDDIPYRERYKDRQARLIAEAESRGRKGTKNNEQLGSDSEDDADAQVSKQIREDGDEDYYQLIAGKAQEKKTAKASRAAAHKQAAAEGATVREVEEVGADGKRAITYAIEKNKGLTPRRNKDVRNPRVKKRKKFEEKKKKLGSIRQVYKGGEGRGGYGGELTGIKTGLVKSRKL